MKGPPPRGRRRRSLYISTSLHLYIFISTSLSLSLWLSRVRRVARRECAARERHHGNRFRHCVGTARLCMRYRHCTRPVVQHSKVRVIVVLRRVALTQLLTATCPNRCAITWVSDSGVCMAVGALIGGIMAAAMPDERKDLSFSPEFFL